MSLVLFKPIYVSHSSYILMIINYISERRKSLKPIFDLLTDPLQLPLPVVWDYIIMIILGVIAFKIAWNIVDKLEIGGTLGSIIHWTVRFVVLVAEWAIVTAMIKCYGWIVSHWILIAIIIAAIVMLIILTYLFLIFAPEGNEEKPCE